MLATIGSVTPVEITRKQMALELLVDVRRLDTEIAASKRRLVACSRSTSPGPRRPCDAEAKPVSDVDWPGRKWRSRARSSGTLRGDLARPLATAGFCEWRSEHQFERCLRRLVGLVQASEILLEHRSCHGQMRPR